LPENADRSRQNTSRGIAGWLGFHELFSGADDDRQSGLDRRDQPDGHLWGGVAVVGAHGAAQVLGAARLLAAAGGDGTIMLWDVQARRLVDRLPSGTGNPTLGMAFSSDGRTLAVSSFRDGDGVITLWDVQQRRLVREVVSLATNGLARVAFRADGRVLAAAGGETLVFWNLADPSGKPQTVSGPAEAGPVAFSPDGRILAREEDNTSIRLWDIERRAAIGSPLVAHSGWLVSLAFSPDGRMLASSDTEGTIRLWDVEARTALGEPLRAHEQPVRGLAFSPDGQHLASVGDDGMTMLWDVGVKAWQARACAVVAPLATVRSAGFRPDSVKPNVCEATTGGRLAKRSIELATTG
jgi:WD40 repeat protein